MNDCVLGDNISKEKEIVMKNKPALRSIESQSVLLYNNSNYSSLIDLHPYFYLLYHTIMRPISQPLAGNGDLDTCGEDSRKQNDNDNFKTK